MDGREPASTVDIEPDILAIECPERKGTVVRHVKLASLSFERLRFLWDKLKGMDVLFNDFVRGDFAAFVNHFVMEVDGEIVPTGLMWDIDDVGIFFLNEIRPGESGQVHFVFWDGIFRGREILCREMLKWGMKEYKFIRIVTEVPLYAVLTMKAVDRIGFVLEGRKRKASLYKGEWFDTNIYSVLAEDLEGVTMRNKTLAVCSSCGRTSKLRKVSNGRA